ncbi:MAG: 50S ribosomal protein L1, partial [Candidatus Woesearchaeota archaeon]
MDKGSVLKSLQELKKNSKKKFKQSVDLVVALKDLNLKKPEEQVEFFATIPYAPGKKKLCG